MYREQLAGHYRLEVMMEQLRADLNSVWPVIMAAKLLLVAASLEIDYTLISAPQTGEWETMDHKYRHLSSGLDSDSAKDIFCDPSLSLSVWSDDDLSKTISIIDPNFDILSLHLH